jgi:tripartite-type tricarboxylate transporter receptor subunit TctC
MLLSHKHFIAAVAAAALVAIAPAGRADDFPTRPIEMIIPTPPGGGTDIALRVLAELAEPFLKQKVVIVNKAGGSGAMGMMSIIQSKPDGYTLGGLWNAPLTMSPHMLPVGYKPTDYATVSLATSAPALFCVKRDFPASDGKEFIAELKGHPGKYTYGNDGVGGTLHLAAERIFHRLGANARAVPFGGAGETLQNYLGGHVDIYAGSIPPIMPYVQEGTSKCLLLTTAKRNTQLPNASSLTDLGIPEEETVLWRGIIAPKATPKPVLAVLEKAFIAAGKTDKFKEFMASRGEEAVGGSGADMRELIDKEYKAMGTVMAELGLGKK